MNGGTGLSRLPDVSTQGGARNEGLEDRGNLRSSWQAGQKTDTYFMRGFGTHRL